MESIQHRSASLDIGHMHIDCVEPTSHERGGHLLLTIDPLISENSDTRSGTRRDVRRLNGVQIKPWCRNQTAVHIVSNALVRFRGTARVITQCLHSVASL